VNQKNKQNIISKSVARKRLGDSNDDHQNAIIGDEVNSI